MKSLMYHYVREDSLEFPFSAHKEKKQFVREIAFLKNQGYSFYNPSDVIVPSFIKRWDPQGIILTFDDGLKDHLFVARLLRDMMFQKLVFIFRHCLS